MPESALLKDLDLPPAITKLIVQKSNEPLITPDAFHAALRAFKKLDRQLSDDILKELRPDLNTFQIEKKASKRSFHNTETERLQSQWEIGILERTGHSASTSETDQLTNFSNERDRPSYHLRVRHTISPFLAKNGSETSELIGSKSRSSLNVLRERDGELAKLANRGSFVVRTKRAERERRRRDREMVKGGKLNQILGDAPMDSATDDSVFDITPTGSDSSLTSSSSKLLLKENSKSSKTTEEQQSEDRFQKILNQKRSLPAYSCKNKLLKVIRENQVTIVVGETGSGKTTQLAQYLYNEEKYGSIACTQPRRVAAVSVAKRVAEEMGTPLGSGIVGYSIRFEDCTSENTRIKYMTEGVLLKESLKSKEFDQYGLIIIDEAHERSLNTDILLGILRKVIANRMDLKIIITSATMNAEHFSSFFFGAPIFTIPGRTFPVEILYKRSISEDYVDSAVKQAIFVHLGTEPSSGDILVFLTGEEDIQVAAELLKERLSLLEKPSPLKILPIYSQLPTEAQQQIFKSADCRKCILATNIAETSLTVDGIVYVIDSGFCKLKLYNPRVGMDVLQVTPISQANAQQRSGRAGRTKAGKAYRLYTESNFKNEMFPSQVPEVQRCNLVGCLLALKALGVSNVVEFPFIDRPPSQNIISSLYDLWRLEAVDDYESITRLGRKMAQLPMDPSLAKCLLTSIDLGCSEDMATIIAMLSVPNVFFRPRERMDEADLKREKLSVAESDHLTLLNVYNLWKHYRFSSSWATEHFLNIRALKRADDVRTQLIGLLSLYSKETPRSCGFEYDIVRKALCSGYFHQAAQSKGLRGEYAQTITGMIVHLHPTSALYGMGILPDYVVYHELLYTSREYMSCVTSVDPRWLEYYGHLVYGDGETPRINESNERKHEFSPNDGRSKNPSIIQQESTKKNISPLVAAAAAKKRRARF